MNPSTAPPRDPCARRHRYSRHVTEEEPEDHTFGELLPAEDRLWRHPSEIAPATGTTDRSSGFRQTLGVAAMSALGGGLIVAGLWLTLGSINTASVEPTVIANPGLADPEWADTVGGGAAEAVAAVELERDGVTTVVAAVGYNHRGFLLTSASGVAGADHVTVVLADGRRLPGTVRGSDPVTDTAVLRVNRQIPIAVLGLDHVASEGTRVAVVGPHGHVSESWIATAAVRVTPDDVATGDDDDHRVYGLMGLAASAVAEPGAVVVDETGAVVGFLNGLDRDGNPTATPIGAARRVAAALATGRTPEHAWLGIQGADHTSEEMGDVALVRSVHPGGPAAVAGLEVDDLVVGVGRTDIASMDELIAELRRHGPGDKLRIDYVRDGERWWCQVVLGQLAPA